MGVTLQQLLSVSENVPISAKVKITEKERSAIPEYELKPWGKQSGRPTGKHHELKWWATVKRPDTPSPCKHSIMLLCVNKTFYNYMPLP